MSEKEYFVLLFKSVNYALRAEKILKEHKINFKLIPVPKSISSECGVCVRFLPEYRNLIEETLLGKVEIEQIRHLQ